MDGFMKSGLDRGPETECHDWSSYLRKLMEIVPPSLTPASRVRALRDPAKEYQLREFTSLVNSFFTAVRSYLIPTNDHRVLTILETRVREAMRILDEQLILEPASQRSLFAIQVLSHALRDVNLDWIKKHQLFYSRLQIEALIAGLRRLDNLAVVKGTPNVTTLIHSAKPQPRPLATVPVGSVLVGVSPYRAAGQLPASPDREAISPRRGRYAIGAILASVAVIVANRNDPPITVSYATPVPHDRRPYSTRREIAPSKQETNYFRHWGEIVDPVKPHTSVVIPTLTAVFNQYPTRLARCYSPENALNIHSATELATYVANNSHARTLVQTISRRNSNRRLTVWWSEDCHDIVIASGHRYSFDGTIRPGPVTVYFTPISH